MSSSKIVRGGALESVQPMPWTLTQRPSIFADSRPHAQEPHGAVSDAEIERRLDQARETGRLEGEASAQQRMRAEVQSAVDRLARAAADLAGYKDRLRRDAERDVVRLAVEIARRLLHREISVDPDALAGLTRAALDKIGAREVHRVRIDPAHAGPVQAALERLGVPQRVEVSADPSLEPGSLIFETSRGDFDASVMTQFGEIERGFAALLEGRRR